MDGLEREAVDFTAMEHSTREEWEYLDRRYRVLSHNLANVTLEMLNRLAGDTLGYRIDRYQHSLQSATRAFRDGQDEETVVCALLHDIGDVMAPENHQEIAAAVLKPYVSPENHWVVLNHAVFQGYYFWHHIGADRNAREKFRDHPLFERAAAFCERYDQNSFDPAYDTMPVEAFEPMVHRLFERQPWRQGVASY